MHVQGSGLWGISLCLPLRLLQTLSYSRKIVLIFLKKVMMQTYV